MVQRRVAKRYAQAIFELAVEKDIIEQIESELCDFHQLAFSDAQIKEFLISATIQSEDKKELVKLLFAQSPISDLNKNFILLLIDRKRIALLEEIINIYRQLKFEHLGIAIARISTPFELTEKQKEALIEKLSKLTGKKIKLQLEVNPDLIGGIKAQVGNKIWDFTIKTQIQRLFQKMIQG